MDGEAFYRAAEREMAAVRAEGKRRTDAATARADRAEAAEADLRATVERVRALLVERQAGKFWYVRIADVLAALDAQRPAEGGPEGEGADGICPTCGDAGGWYDSDDWVNCSDCWMRTDAALDGGQPDTPAPTRKCWGCSHGDHVRCERATDVCECDCAPAPTRSGWVPEDGTPVQAIIQSDGSAGTFVVEPVGGEGRTDADPDL